MKKTYYYEYTIDGEPKMNGAFAAKECVAKRYVIEDVKNIHDIELDESDVKFNEAMTRIMNA